MINEFIIKNELSSVIEFGCGDGHQLSLGHYPKYLGLDVSATALNHCIARFKNDISKSFYLYNSSCFADNHRIFHADITLSLDVIYHLIEDHVFNQYMNHLFKASDKFVIIYSSNFNKAQVYHERDRKFSDWIEMNKKEWELAEIIKNPKPYDPAKQNQTSKSDFYIYKKRP